MSHLLLISALLLGAPQSAPTSQKTVVLVHGAWADGSSWAKVIPLLEAKGLHVVAVQNPLTSLADDVAAVQQVLDSQTGPVILVGHSWAGVVITQVGTDPKVSALVYVSAFAPDVGESINDLGKGLTPPPGLASVRPGSAGFLYLTAEGVAKDFGPDLSASETKLMAATQGPIAAKVFDEKVTQAAWKTKPSWCVVSLKDRMIQPDLEKAMAKKINATTTLLQASHVSMLSKPKDVAAVIVSAAAAIK